MKPTAKKDSDALRFLYGTAAGRVLLRLFLLCRGPKLAAGLLCSPLSRLWIQPYARKHGVLPEELEGRRFRSFREFFIRERQGLAIDEDPRHLISPCDGCLSVHPIRPSGVFWIKKIPYKLEELLLDRALAARYEGGDCLIFRLRPSDYHRYCYIDDGRQGPERQIPGELHAVQPVCCETYPVYIRNRRAWTLLETEHFGPVVQVEIGAMAVGGIVNHGTAREIRRGEEKGHFDLAGSTIVLLLEAGRAGLLPEFRGGGEREVRLGEQIGFCASR